MAGDTYLPYALAIVVAMASAGIAALTIGPKAARDGLSSRALAAMRSTRAGMVGAALALQSRILSRGIAAAQRAEGATLTGMGDLVLAK